MLRDSGREGRDFTSSVTRNVAGRIEKEKIRF